jgi:hypothetical protein
VGDPVSPPADIHQLVVEADAWVYGLMGAIDSDMGQGINTTVWRWPLELARSMAWPSGTC